jgi:hypothetical protein
VERVSIILIDIDIGVYDFVGVSYATPAPSPPIGYTFYTYDYCSANSAVFININRDGTLLIFNLDPLSFAIKNQQIVKIPNKAFLFTFVGGNVVFATIGSESYREFDIQNFQAIQNNGSFVEIGNTGVQIDFEIPEPRPRLVSLFTTTLILGCPEIPRMDPFL